MKRSVAAKTAFVIALFVLGSAVVSFAGSGRFEVKDQVVEDQQTHLLWIRDLGMADSEMSWEDAGEFVKTLNTQKFAGYADWRMPDVEEMKKLNLAVKQATGVDQLMGTTLASLLEKIGFKNAQAANYWTSTSSLFNEADAWQYSLTDGTKAMANKSLYRYVWAVRWQR